MKLVLVESPTKARKLSGYLGAEYVVRASVGHIRDLPKSKMGVDVEHNFEPEYVIPKDKSKVVKELKSLAKEAEQIILATDPDREGEAIGWHLQTILSDKEDKKNSSRFVRSSFHEITKSAILDAIAHPATLNLALVDAQQARRVLDRLVGYTVSPVLWKKIRYGLSAGRVQSVALRLIAEREREIAAFTPEEYWEVDVLLSKLGEVKKHDKYFINNKIEEIPQNMFVARVSTVNGKTYEPKTAADVEPILQKLDSAEYRVSGVEKKERRRVSLPPFTTSTLQQQSANRYGYTSKTTMRLAQQLYEEGLITYHRTDSVNLASQAIQMAREYIDEQCGPVYLPEKPRYFANNSKNAQEAHEAIRPTTVTVRLNEVAARLSDQHAKLYDLIWRRFVASQMEAAIYDQTTVTVSAAGITTSDQLELKASGSILKFEGWMKYFPNQGDVILPDLTAQQQLQFIEKNAAQKFTLPPPRYNDASLIKTLEKEGIGRPSTYASIISVIEERGYIDRQDKKFVPTAIGLAVNDFLIQHFNNIVDYKFTANMEDDLDAVARGEKEWRKIVAEFYQPLASVSQQVVEKAERAQIPVEKTGEPCPKCGPTEHGEIVIRSGKFGKFKSCSRFPECDFTQNIVNKVPGVICPLCQQGDVVIKPTRYGKDFYSCSRYPECNWASWRKPAVGYTLTAEEWAKEQAERAERAKARAEKYGDKKQSRFAKKTSRSSQAKTPSKTRTKVAKKATKKKA
jgi:DNA topoisomerase-1